MEKLEEKNLIINDVISHIDKKNYIVDENALSVLYDKYSSLISKVDAPISCLYYWDSESSAYLIKKIAESQGKEFRDLEIDENDNSIIFVGEDYEGNVEIPEDRKIPMIDGAFKTNRQELMFKEMKEMLNGERDDYSQETKNYKQEKDNRFAFEDRFDRSNKF